MNLASPHSSPDVCTLAYSSMCPKLTREHALSSRTDSCGFVGVTLCPNTGYYKAVYRGIDHGLFLDERVAALAVSVAASTSNHPGSGRMHIIETTEAFQAAAMNGCAEEMVKFL